MAARRHLIQKYQAYLEGVESPMKRFEGTKSLVKTYKTDTPGEQKEEKMKGEDPCWKGYEMVGQKIKAGRKVPNCVPKNEEIDIVEYGDTAAQRFRRANPDEPDEPSYNYKKRYSSYRAPEKQEPHAVHINGKKWKTFGSQRHAQNVANKIKGATVHKEEVEQIDELSPELMRRAADKYQDKINRSEHPAETDKLLDKQARMSGQARRTELGKRYNKEEVEQINEIGDTSAGKQMLGAYVKKAARRVGVHASVAAQYADTAGSDTATPSQRRAASTLALHQKHKRDMRLRGIERATDRITKEEVEIDEAKKFGYDAINARFKKQTDQSLEDRAKHYAATSERLKKMQADYEAQNKKKRT